MTIVPEFRRVSVRVGIRREQRFRYELVAALLPAPHDPDPRPAVEPRQGRSIVWTGGAEGLERLQRLDPDVLPAGSGVGGGRLEPRRVVHTS